MPVEPIAFKKIPHFLIFVAPKTMNIVSSAKLNIYGSQDETNFLAGHCISIN